MDAPAKVEMARGQQEARSVLEEVLPGAGGRALLVSPHDYLGTLLLPLRRSGVLKELVVLLPYDNVLTEGHIEELRGFLERGGIPEEDRRGLRFQNGSIRGVIDGMPVTVSTLKALPKQEGEFLVVIDTAFLPVLYRNEVKTPMVDLAWKLVLTLRERKIRADAVVLFDAAGRPDFPLEYGFLAHLLREMISAPDAFAEGPPEKWRTLKAADAAYFFSQYAEGMELYRMYLGKNPSDASACYKIAAMASRDLDVDLVLHWLNRAAAADPFYRRAFAELAGYFFRKEMFDASERILQSGLSGFPNDPVISTNLAVLYISRGEAAREAGYVEIAAEYYRQAAGVKAAEPSMRDRAISLGESLSAAAPAPN